MDIQIIFYIIVLIVSVIIHEVSHGYAADKLGDPTARLAGRLTLNPVSHIDPLGSVIVPFISYLAGFPFGWAKPVPFNPYNLKSRWGEAIIAFAGPLSNIVIALVFGFFIKNFTSFGFPDHLMALFHIITFTNLGLALFNLIPVPPLDGSKILFSFLSYRFMVRFREVLEQYGLFLMIFVIFFGGKIIIYPLILLFYLITGSFPTF